MRVDPLFCFAQDVKTATQKNHRIIMDHKQKQWIKLLGIRKTKCYRQVRKCRQFEVCKVAKKSVLCGFLGRVESLREEHGDSKVPSDVRSKHARVKKMLGHVREKEFESDSEGEEEQGDPRKEECLHSCVDCTSKQTLDDNYQCPGCGQDYCHDCVDLEKWSNKDGLCNRCLDKDLRRCRVCVLEVHVDDTWQCPGCGLYHCDSCEDKKEIFTKECDNCCECMCSYCEDTSKCGLCSRPYVIDLVSSSEE